MYIHVHVSVCVITMIVCRGVCVGGWWVGVCVFMEGRWSCSCTSPPSNNSLLQGAVGKGRERQTSLRHLGKFVSSPSLAAGTLLAQCSCRRDMDVLTCHCPLNRRSLSMFPKHEQVLSRFSCSSQQTPGRRHSTAFL